MINEHIEYDRDVNPYPSFGKKYNGEKAVISLTSWKARINTVAKTVYSLIKRCPGFHIVLALSEEEFPKMMDELPENLKLFVNNELIEVLWVYKNYKSFKKVLFTMDKYRDVPVISADDDCIYTCNYAQMLYNKWKTHKNKIISFNIINYFNKYNVCSGPCTIYPPSYFGFFNLSKLNEILKIHPCDDWLYAILYRNTPMSLNKADPFIFHDSIQPITFKKFSHEYRRRHFSYYESCLK